ncbi:MAG TPA: universal stress protein [Gemmatimonadales bacterium]|nr:universal stress protein [Gemmatimonadales bacterium]
MKFQRVMVALDDTPAALHALRAAAQIAQAADAELFALRVFRDAWEGVRPDEVEGLRRRHTAPADVAESRFAAMLQDTIATTVGSARAKPLVRFGIAGIEIPRWAHDYAVDLLVLGQQPLGALERRPSGRTLAEALQTVKVSCLVVPFGQRDWSEVLAVRAVDGDWPVDRAAEAFAALWRAKPATTMLESEEGAPDAALGAAVTRVIGQIRERNITVVVVPARFGERFVERAPCAVLTVPERA